MHKYSTHKCTIYAHVYTYVNACIHPRMEISHQRSTNLSNPLLVFLREDSRLPKTKPPGTITAPQRYQLVYFVYIICQFNTYDNMANALMCFKLNRTKEGGRNSVWAHGGATGVTILRVGPNRPTDLPGLFIIPFQCCISNLL